jgi:hypothetical protein
MSVAPGAERGHSEPPALQPNAGTPPNAPKQWYVSERIIVTEVGGFQNDHDRWYAAPGFHIFGSCPSCHHATSSVCATEYLAQDVDQGHGGSPGSKALVAPDKAAAPEDKAAAAEDKAAAAEDKTATAEDKAATAVDKAAAPQYKASAPQDKADWVGEVGEVRRLQGDGQTPSLTDHSRRLWRGFTTTHPPHGEARPAEAEPEPIPKTMLTVMRCACTYNHAAQPGAPSPPPDTFGCGSQWVVRVLYDDAPQLAEILPAGELEATYCWPAADAAAAQVPSALTNARASAKNWSAGLTAILTLGGIGALLTSESTVRSLNTFWQVMFGIFAFVAVIANGVMLYQTTIASYGSSRSADALRPSDLRDADLDALIQARATVKQLHTAILATAVAVLAALFAAGILLYGTTTPAPTTPTTTSVLTQTQP